ncbi:SMI1 / KNR4 family [Mycobacteroides abscessus subsp. massiliense]|uniref:SMI1/KNR4 family protein n=1 Tax=Mycobacteroides abscessus TaxID=36809 RepID=UPI00092B429E|nr:SMI1/KNR4 family protein [Mycobacteroides abscessus]SHR63906.1 SMI1 / KNR4 family [Mycobacteroides abscessus subsp. abscessus]SKG48462.1 SMI1 / KNR4 family [Mycobacteroides abscessus subsp. massiliense]SKG99870.1 SMI1 / KNR4 family [Mycobacteroides abscessus subsp. massiliense]SKH98178.1 SMI1 / KNR4 family [Mycobacteroides abscessus subsp. massiliense]SKJ27664.1 SMI1 / KNR4 family [Mycobacteroides abscessus subsp. massiliense]
MDPAQIWRVPPYEGYVQAPLTDELLEEAEQHLGVRLPAAYVSLLRVQNGGYLRVGFPNDRDYNVTHAIIRGIGTEYPRLTKDAWWHDEEDFEPIPAGAEWLIPFDGDGHWDLCFDYRRSPTDAAGLRTDPAVVVIDTEKLDPDIESLVADSFDTYLAQLVPSDDE